MRHQVSKLLQTGADPNIPCDNYGCALQAAAYYGHEETVHILLANQALVNEPADASLLPPGLFLTGSRSCGNALNAAAASGHEAIARILIDNGAHVNAHVPSKFGYGASALYIAARNGNSSMVILRLLLDNGAEVDAVSSVFGTAIQLATQIGAIRMVEVLIEKGANVNMDGGYYGESLINATALDIAKWNGDGQMYRLLECNGAFSSSVCPTMDDSEDHWQPESSFRQERERLRKLQTHRKADSEDPYARPGHPLTFHSKNQPAVFF
ncbi:ankyrin [Ascobolus immersus RN42]|uniref:Ankyrin n=1 Tax=Ascobolus immersus RN42 TaxID=1160509 RepID=A0A3N4HRU2_ASCIM|nr:ankyrin [Ascobolus immersus RN42]